MLVTLCMCVGECVLLPHQAKLDYSLKKPIYKKDFCMCVCVCVRGMGTAKFFVSIFVVLEYNLNTFT